jgi:hypothetical protein
MLSGSRIAAVAMALGFAVPAQAATITASNQGYVSIVGEIVPGDELVLTEQLKTPKGRHPVEVRLNSPGGALATGSIIAEMVREVGLTAHVPYRGQCYSACVIIFAAARERIANSESNIGVHSASLRGQENENTLAVTTRFARAMAEYGAPPSVIGKMVATPPSAMTTLTIADLEAWNVAIARGVPGRKLPPPQSSSVTPEQMMRFVVGADNKVDRAIQFYSWPWDEKVRYIKSVGGQYTKTCFRGGDCIHQTEALTLNRKYAYAVRSNSRTDEKAFCVTSFDRGRKACYSEESGDVLFLYSSEGKWKKVEHTIALSMIY